MKYIKQALHEEIPNYAIWRKHNIHYGDCGAMPSDFEVIKKAYADFDEDGKCTCITVYSGDNAKMRRHYEMWDGVIDITEIILGWDDLLITYDYKKVRKMIIEQIHDEYIKSL